MPDTDQIEISPAEAQEIEAEQHGHYVPVPFGDDKWDVIPPGAWRQSWLRQLKAGDMDTFMANILSPQSYDLYLDADPTNDDLGAFLNRAGETGGEPLGKSVGPRRSSTGTRKR
ncbi:MULTISPECIES: hypothetical protein [unclassified Streptomyces]|uniref:hypothetical protein n=1 Tax=unclassified Streptomyces TaxID=2593676 RepID=UPI0033C8A9EE